MTRRVVPRELLTPRLRLRPPQAGDGAAVNAGIAESLAQLQPWMPWAERLPSVADSEEFCARAAQEFAEGSALSYLMFDRATDAFVGSTGIPRLDWDVPSFEIGYWCRTAATGQGLVHEACVAIAHMAFSQLRAVRLELRIESTNLASQAVARRLGFDQEALLRRSSVNTRKEVVDMLVFVCFDPARLPAQPELAAL